MCLFKTVNLSLLWTEFWFSLFPLPLMCFFHSSLESFLLGLSKSALTLMVMMPFSPLLYFLPKHFILSPCLTLHASIPLLVPYPRARWTWYWGLNIRLSDNNFGFVKYEKFDWAYIFIIYTLFLGFYQTYIRLIIQFLEVCSGPFC